MTISAGVDEFLAAVPRLTGADIGVVRAAALEIGPPARKEARRALKLSAAEKSSLEKRARDAVRQMDLTGGVAAVGADAVTSVLSATNAIASRHSLTAEQYAALTGPFAGFDVPIPAFDA